MFTVHLMLFLVFPAFVYLEFCRHWAKIYDQTIENELLQNFFFNM